MIPSRYTLKKKTTLIWSDCSVEGCSYKTCLSLNSDKCFPHTKGPRQWKLFKIWVRNTLQKYQSMKTINTITLVILAIGAVIVQFQIRERQKTENMLVKEINELYSRVNTNTTIDSLYVDFNMKHIKAFDTRLDTLEHTAGWK